MSEPSVLMVAQQVSIKRISKKRTLEHPKACLMKKATYLAKLNM